MKFYFHANALTSGAISAQEVGFVSMLEAKKKDDWTSTDVEKRDDIYARYWKWVDGY